MYEPTRLWEALAYNKINQEKKWLVLNGYDVGKILTFVGIKSYDGDVDIITMKDQSNDEIIDFIENINIIQVD